MLTDAGRLHYMEPAAYEDIQHGLQSTDAAQQQPQTSQQYGLMHNTFTPQY